MTHTDDLRVEDILEIPPPTILLEEYPCSANAESTTDGARRAIHRILSGADDRLLVVIGPCSIHDPVAAIDYAERLLAARQRLIADLEIVMRVYFEKPRTTVGWKGLINDPDLDGSFQIDKGLRVARKLLLNINDLGLPAASEFLDPITPQYIADLISWGAIGARTTESQTHRELASGLSCPIGFKNGTDGNIQIAIDAIEAASHPHCFLGVTKDGRSAIVKTRGNQDCHVILRGGKAPNYDQESVEAVSTELEKANLEPKVMIDASHANSLKQHQNQMAVCSNIAERIGRGEKRISGVMVESHIVAGRQTIEPGRKLIYGQSITDGCIDWRDSLVVLEQLAQAVRKRRQL